MIMSQQQALRRTTFGSDVPEPKKFSPHVEKRLEEYYQTEPLPNDGQKAFFASNLGVEPWHVEVWFHHRRERDAFSQLFAALRVEDSKVGAHEGPRMILPANLSELLDISLPGQSLLLDIRSSTEFQRSHIRGAIHLRAPQSFLRPASLDMVERAFPDAQSRRIFSRWQQARCIVFYSRGLEYPWECPSADTLLEKLWACGWHGRCFILKGHYREFSDSFSKHVYRVQDNDAEKEAPKEAPISEGMSSNETELVALFARLETEDQTRHLSSSPGHNEERTTALVEQEKALESEFQNHFPALFKKAQDVHGVGRSDDESFVTKAQMVEYLDRGLTKIRDGQASQAEATVYEPGHSKLAADSYFDRTNVNRESDEYVEVPRGDEAASDGSPQMTTKGKETRAASSPDEITPRVRGSGLLNKVFRRA